MALDTSTELINSVKSRFTDKLAGIKDFILKKGGELDKLSTSENHWKLKTDPNKPSSETDGWNDWEDYINGIDAFTPTTTWTKEQQWGKIKGDILSVLARLIIKAVKTEQDKEKDATEKKNWWNNLNAYITTNNTDIEKNTYDSETGLDGANYKQIIADIKTAGTTPTPPPPVITQDTQADLIKSIEDNYFVGKLAGLKTEALQELNKGYDGSGYAKGSWTGDWKTYISDGSANPATNDTTKKEFIQRKKAVLYKLAIIVIELVKKEQDKATDQNEKKKWFDEIELYHNTHKDEAENYVFSGAGGNTSYNVMLNAIKAAGTTSSTYGGTTLVGLAGSFSVANGQRAYDNIKDRKSYEPDKGIMYDDRDNDKDPRRNNN